MKIFQKKFAKIQTDRFRMHNDVYIVSSVFA